MSGSRICILEKTNNLQIAGLSRCLDVQLHFGLELLVHSSHYSRLLSLQCYGSRTTLLH